MIKIGEGETADVYRVKKGQVLKLFKEEFYDTESFNLEFTASKHIGSISSFAPKIYEKVTHGSRYGYIMEEYEGSLFQKIIDENKLHFTTYARELGKLHRELHDKEITKELSKLPKCCDFLEEMLLRQTIFSDEITTWLISLLKKLSTPESLLHGDFMPYNIIYANDGMKIIDWAEPSIGPAVLDVARTINYIKDTTDFVESIITMNSNDFILNYLCGYEFQNSIEIDRLHEAFLINAACEVTWAEKSKNVDEYSDYLKELIIKNFKSDSYIYIDEMSNRGLEE